MSTDPSTGTPPAGAVTWAEAPATCPACGAGMTRDYGTNGVVHYACGQMLAQKWQTLVPARYGLAGDYIPSTKLACRNAFAAAVRLRAERDAAFARADQFYQMAAQRTAEVDAADERGDTYRCRALALLLTAREWRQFHRNVFDWADTLRAELTTAEAAHAAEAQAAEARAAEWQRRAGASDLENSELRRELEQANASAADSEGELDEAWNAVRHLIEPDKFKEGSLGEWLQVFLASAYAQAVDAAEEWQSLAEDRDLENSELRRELEHTNATLAMYRELMPQFDAKIIADLDAALAATPPGAGEGGTSGH